MSRVYVINWRIKFVNFQFCWFKPHQGSMYLEGVFSISNFWNHILHVVLEIHLVIILIIIFCSSKTLLLFTDFPQNMKPFSITAWEYLLTYSMEKSLSWEANQFSSSQEIPPHFMEPGGSLLHSQVPATCPYPKYQSRCQAFCVNIS
jgi:hypothetical protein